MCETEAIGATLALFWSVAAAKYAIRPEADKVATSVRVAAPTWETAPEAVTVQADVAETDARCAVVAVAVVVVTA